MLLAVLVHALVQHRLNMAKLLLDGLKIHRQVLQANIPNISMSHYAFFRSPLHIYLVQYFFGPVLAGDDEYIGPHRDEEYDKGRQLLTVSINSGHGVMKSWGKKVGDHTWYS